MLKEMPRQLGLGRGGAMGFNLAVILSETAHSSPDRPVAVFTGGQLTYRELDKASDRLAASLAAAGIRPGDPVALQLPNIPQFLISYFGILKAGGIVVPLNVMLKAPEVAFHLGDSGARVLITWEGVLAEAAKGAESAGLDQIYAVGHAGDSAVAVPFERLLDVSVPHFEMATRQPTDTAVIVYTSGTTGRPKGAELTHIQLYMNADIPGRLFDVQPDDIVIAVLPLFHVFGLSSIMDVCVRFGCTMSLLPRFTPAAVLAAIQRDRATIFEGVPTMFANLLSCPDLDSYDLSSLRVAISGGASIPAPVLDAFEDRLGLVILEGYGMTETASTTTFNPSAAERRAYSVGKPIWGTQTQVRDSGGRPLPPGRENVGETVTRGMHVMKGYLHNPEATASAFTGDWLHTGDLGYFDEDGFLFIVSRKKELIIRGGYNVYPSEIENVLHAHPAIAEAAVVGVPDERLGEEVMAVVILRPAMGLLEHELRSYCRERLAAYKCPRVFQFRSELPKNILGKVLKGRTDPRLSRRPTMLRTTMDRMSTLDAEFFFAEYDNVPMHIGSVAVFDGPAPAYQDVMRLFEAKLPKVPRYRQVARTTPGQVLRPVWADDEHFNIRHHVRHATVPAPGGPDQLRAVAATLFALRLDRRRPLWDEWFLDGLEGDPDPLRRLSLIRQQMDNIKHTDQAVSAEILTGMLGLAAPTWLALGTQAAFRIPQPLIQTVTTNIPGPRSRLYVLGRSLTALYPYVPIGNAVRISAAILSYVDTVSFGVTADHDSLPDLDVFVEGIKRGLAELRGLAAG